MDDLGKVAEIADSQSPLKLGLSGDYKGHKFELTGRAQLKHELGGFWDEWYATFSNGWLGWLAEAQGKFYLTFYQPLEGRQVPDFNSLQLGQPVQEIPSQTPLMVTEKGTATSVAADGEIPYKLIPNEQSNYADLSGSGNAFATIDYSENPAWVFVGQQVTLDEIGLGGAKSAEREAAKVSSAAMGCPNCGGPLTLAVPDKTERVTCPFCNSLLDVNQGNLTFLKSLTPSPSPHEFILPIGAEGTFENVKQKIIGAVVRSVTFDGIKYFWHEYLLYNPSIGFRWLVHSDNHWNYVQPVNPADVLVNEAVGKPTATFDGTTFKIFQDAGAVVEYVKGEFYWRVSQGEAVRAVDYVKAPLMLSMERGANEINWSLGTYKTNKEIEETFGVSDLPKPWSVAPNQPFTGGFYYTYGLIPLLLLFIVAVFMLPISGGKSTILAQEIVLPPMSNATTAQTIFTQQFEVKGNRNVRVTAQTPGLDNSWVELDADLVNDQNSDVESVPIIMEYYQGSDSDGAWTEGKKEEDATMSSLPAGKYTLRLAGSWGNWQQPLPVRVKVEQNVVRGINFCCAFFILLIIPLLAIFRKLTFESKKWSESMFSNTGS